MNPTLKAYIQLCRPANLPTAAADILAGVAVMSFSPGLLKHMRSLSIEEFVQLEPRPIEIFLLCLASVCLYAGGVVLNDFFDADLDAIERPERPIPAGVVSKAAVLRFGLILLLLGVGIASILNPVSGAIAAALSGMIVLYNWKAKHHSIAGPLAMGSCRSLNLLLGMSLLPGEPYWIFLLIPLLFIGAITAISQGEVHGGKSTTQGIAAILYFLVGAILLYLALSTASFWWFALGLLLLFYAMVLPPLYKAWKEPIAGNIRKAVKWGVISLIVLDAAMASAYVGPLFTLMILALFPLSRTLSKVFAVT